MNISMEDKYDSLPLLLLITQPGTSVDQLVSNGTDVDPYVEYYDPEAQVSNIPHDGSIPLVEMKKTKCYQGTLTIFADLDWSQVSDD